MRDFLYICYAKLLVSVLLFSVDDILHCFRLAVFNLLVYVSDLARVRV